jgi:pantoate--beta-alanine ligase
MLEIIETVAELRHRLNQQHNIALVPTMGNLHAGHLQLVSIAKQQGACVVVSIFVNPLQFGANEDLASYPRSLDADCAQLKAAGADIVFIPSVVEMYPDFDGTRLNQSMTVTVPAFADELCGATRPGHFAGVATIVMKLFHIVMPQVAVFGKKDFQQLLVIRALVKQYNLPIAIVAADTLRTSDGLALSSRNSLLSEAHKVEAAQLQQQLQQIATSIEQGQREFSTLEQAATTNLNARGWQVDYISVRSALTLAVARAQDQQLIVMAAARLGETRLIDNVEFLR